MLVPGVHRQGVEASARPRLIGCRLLGGRPAFADGDTLNYVEYLCASRPVYLRQSVNA